MYSDRKELLAIREALNESQRGLTIMEISKAVGMNRHSVAKYLEVLVTAGYVDMRSFGPSKIFSISQRVPISAMMSFSSDFILTLDRDLRVRYINDGLLAFIGRRRENVLQKNIENFIRAAPVDPPLIPYIQLALDGHEASAEVFYGVGAEGYFFMLKALPTIFEDGEKGVTLIATDITVRVKAEAALKRERSELEVRVKERTAELEGEISKRIAQEKALRESEEKYRNLVENIKEIVWEIDAKGKMVYVSNGIKHMLGYEPSEVLGTTIDVVLTPTDKSRIRDETHELLKKPQTYNMLDAHVYHKDGHEIIIESSGTPVFDADGTLRGYRGVIHDITARKQTEEALRRAEQKLRNIVENVYDIVWEMDREARFTYVSPKVLNLVGNRPDYYIGREITEFLPPEDIFAFTENFNRVLADPQQHSMERLRIYHKDGSILTFEVNSSPFYDNKGQFCGFQGISRLSRAGKPNRSMQ